MSAAPVLDSFALLAFLRGEAGDDKVAALLEKAGARDAPLRMTEVNYAEVKYIVLRKDGAAPWADVARELPTLPIEFHPADRELADVAADFKCRFSLSLADAFAAALAKKHKAELVTGDPEFKAVEKEIKVNWLE
ncbi:MAG TPA: PIN domain-containing protein [Verrucomicrobiota bacterium]|nr:PIN domain-containing protein [Verrucomicrobiota bacterium]HRZ38688.1 PIN domain-containing protein [Candidatus Paceibacterota bacterium]